VSKGSVLVDELDWCSITHGLEGFLQDFDNFNIYMIAALWYNARSNPSPALKRFYLSGFHNACHLLYYAFVVLLALIGNVYMPFLYVKELFSGYKSVQNIVDSVSAGPGNSPGLWQIIELERDLVVDTCPDNASMEVKVMVFVMFTLLCHQAFATFKGLPQQYAFVRALRKQQTAQVGGVELKFAASPTLWLSFVANILSLLYVPVLLDLMFVHTEDLKIADVVLNGLSVYFVLEIDDMLVTAGDKVFVKALVDETLSNMSEEDKAPKTVSEEDPCSQLLLIFWALGGLLVVVLYAIIVAHAGKCV